MLIPTRVLEFLGLEIDSRAMTLTLTVRQSSKSHEKVLGFDFKSINNHRGISQPRRFTLLNSSGNFTSPSSNTISTVSIYSGNKGRSKPSIQNSAQPRFDAGIRVGEWTSNPTPERHQGDHSNRCIKEGLGFILPEQNNKGTMDSTGKLSTHKCTRNDSDKTCFLPFRRL